MDTKKRLFICRIGCAFLHTFLLTCAIAIGVILPGLLGKYASHGTLFEEPVYWIVVCLLVIMVEATIFWIGIITVYLTCSQLGIKFEKIKDRDEIEKELKDDLAYKLSDRIEIY